MRHLQVRLEFRARVPELVQHQLGRVVEVYVQVVGVAGRLGAGRRLAAFDGGADLGLVARLGDEAGEHDDGLGHAATPALGAGG